MLCSVPGCNKKRDRQGLCQMHHWRLRVHGDVNYVPYKPRVCIVEGCNRRHKGYGYCKFHLERFRKGLPLDGPLRTLHPKRYRIVTRRDHPLAMKNGRVAVHRMVFYDQIGNSRIPCFWCGTSLEWRINLFVDHLDHDRHNNQPTNLVPSCNSCNAGRMLVNSRIRTSVYQRVVDGTVVGS